MEGRPRLCSELGRRRARRTDGAVVAGAVRGRRTPTAAEFGLELLVHGEFWEFGCAGAGFPGNSFASRGQEGSAY